jgi:arylsulfatase A-like enzyme
MKTLIACFFAFFSLRLMAAEKPNIVVILADDLGYGDVSCYNPTRGKINTPHIDRLAAQGMRFTDAHSSSSVCSPSRYTLLTGRYHWRSSLQTGIVDLWGAPLIAPDRISIASLARERGYHTSAIGKWHLGWDWPIEKNDRSLFEFRKNETPEATPRHLAAWKHTFSQKIAGGPTTRGFDSYFGTDVPNWPPYCFIENDRTIGLPSTPLAKKDMGNNRASRMGPALPDWSLEAILPALSQRACETIKTQAAKESPYLLYLALTTPHTPLAVNAAWRGKSGLDNDCADLILETDAAIGQVLDAIEQSGEAANTLVLFTSDNGFAPYVGAKQLEAKGHYPSGPLRGYKFDVWEGGHRLPFIIRWPGVVKAGSVSDQLVHHADLLATLADIWQSPLPANAGEDSHSLLPILRGKDQSVRETAISCSANGVPGLRVGSWKFIPAPEPQLYDLATDLAESTNRAKEMPERVKEMRQTLETLITQGRSTPGPRQKNDVTVRRHGKPSP